MSAENWSGWEARQDNQGVTDDGRTAYQRDYARVVHSAAFRCLQAKTQVLGLGDSDFYRTRLTHSMEVSQIGEGIARELPSNCEDVDPKIWETFPDPILIRAICLAHDLGHPPFGHGGEIALNSVMCRNGGFEGNGQSLRIMSHLEPYHEKFGMNLSRRTLLGVVKYPAPYSKFVVEESYPQDDPSEVPGHVFKPPKCYLDDETDVVNWISDGLVDWPKVSKIYPPSEDAGSHGKTRHKSLDATVLEIADDIAYGTHDLEDAIALRLVTKSDFEELGPERMFEPFAEWKDGMKYKDLLDSLFGEEVYKRKTAIGKLVGYCVRNIKLDTSNPCDFEHPIFAAKVQLESDPKQVLGALQDIVVKKVINTTTVQQLEFKGQKIIRELFHAFMSDPQRLLPSDKVKRYEQAKSNNSRQEEMRVVCDYIAGMTDDYAVRRYQQMFVPDVGSVFDHLD